MKRTKLTAVLAALPLSMALLAGCGGDTEGTANPSATPTVQAPEVQGRGPGVGSGTPGSEGGGSTLSPTTAAPGDDEDININEGEASPAPTTTTAPPAGDPNAPGDLGENTGPESNYGGTNNAQCQGVQGPIPRGEDGYNESRDADGDGIACEPNDGGTGVTSDGSPPPTEPGAPADDSGGASLGVPDGAVIWAITTAETRIYASTNTSSQALGTAALGAEFKGTVTANGQWVKIDRSAGYIPASAVMVDRRL